MKINLITVCTNTYPTYYARKLIKRFTEVTNLDVTPYCITDRPEDLFDVCTTIPNPEGWQGWWNKMMVYGDQMPDGYNLYMDIDTVIVKNFDEEIEHAVKQNKKISCVSDAIMWMNNKFSSSVMIVEKNRMLDVYNRFVAQAHALQDFRGGDQVWTGQFLNEKDIFYIDETFPNFKLNLKFHLGEKIMGQWKFPQHLSSKVKIVDCGGRPKPHELPHLPYIKENWHDIEV